MREVQNTPVSFTSRRLFGLGGRFPVREVQNFAGICISRKPSKTTSRHYQGSTQ
jgi:hypothetical protein